MFLTRFAINSARREARKLLGSPQAMHAAVLASYPPGALEGAREGRVLWRVDEGERRATHLYLAGPVPPDLTALVEQAGWPTTSTWETRDYRPLLDRLGGGQRWAFRLTANPVRSVRLPGKEDTQPVGHTTIVQQQEWLLTRAARCGFSVPVDEVGVPHLSVTRRRVVRFSRAGSTVSLAQATFDGALEVVDPPRLRQALTSGIGRAKGYGCGLMTLAPVA